MPFIHPIVYLVDPNTIPSPGAETTKTSPDDANQRRSTRLLVAVPVILSGHDAKGERFREECKTTFINRQGASISVSHVITPGTELLVENPPLGIRVRARAVRFVEKTAAAGLHQVAVELLELKNVWGIRYPPQDWQRSLPTPVRPEKKASPVPATIEIALPPQLQSLTPYPQPPIPNLQPPAPNPQPVTGSLHPEGVLSREFVENSLAKATTALDARLQDAFARLEANRSDFCGIEERLTHLAETAAGSCASLEALISKKEEIEVATRSELENFRADLQRASSEARDQAVSSLALSAEEAESERGRALETLQVQAEEATRTGLEGFRGELQQQAQAFRESLLPEIAREAAAQSATEFANAKVALSSQVKEEIQLATRSELENFRAELERASSEARDQAVSSLALSAEEAESERGRALETLQVQAEEATRASLESFRGELQQQAQAFRESLLPEIAREAAAQSATEFANAKVALSTQVKEEIQLATRSELENFRAELERASREARDQAVSSLALSAEELLTEQVRATREAEEQVGARLERFQGELESRAREFQHHAVTLLEQPTREIAKYAEDTLLMAREEAELLRNSFIEGTQAQMGAITRGTLASMTGESKAITEEYRTQLRAAFESIKEKSAVELRSAIQEALDQGRDSALRQLQKDAEDFSAVAVGEFRGKSEEAIRDASDAVNKHVGAAAFVVKEWADQATQRLESYMDRMEKRSDGAIEAIENRSLDLSETTLERFRKDSETLLMGLRQRIQKASEALTGDLPQADQRESKASELSALEDAASHAAEHLK
ncbi:MAG: hypothetical protein ACRD2B_06945 [Terriglobia bacterium]